MCLLASLRQRCFTFSWKMMTTCTVTCPCARWHVLRLWTPCNDCRRGKLKLMHCYVSEYACDAQTMWIQPQYVDTTGIISHLRWKCSIYTILRIAVYGVCITRNGVYIHYMPCAGIFEPPSIRVLPIPIARSRDQQLEVCLHGWFDMGNRLRWNIHYE